MAEGRPLACPSSSLVIGTHGQPGGSAPVGLLVVGQVGSVELRCLVALADPEVGRLLAVQWAGKHRLGRGGDVDPTYVLPAISWNDSLHSAGDGPVILSAMSCVRKSS